MSKRITLLLIIILAASNLIVVSAVSASATIPTPSVPEFTLKYKDLSYDVPPSYVIDPYTGENVTNAGYRVENRTIELTIANQPFTSYIDNSTGAPWNITLCYNVRLRGYYAGNWTDVYNPSYGYPEQSNSDPTVISYSIDDNVYPLWGRLQQGGQIDVQVQALIGYVHRDYNPNTTDQLQMWPWIFTGEESGWSNTQTITIDGSASTTTPTASSSQYPTATPDTSGDVNQQGFNWAEISLFAALGVIVALLVVITLMYRKQKR